MTNVIPPPFRLALLRHADADWPMPGERDIDRKLSIFGEREAHSASRFLTTFGFAPQHVITSPATRCVMTVALIQEEIFHLPNPVMHAELYNSSADEYLNTICQYIDEKSLLLAGHNPSLEELLVKLIGEDAAFAAMPHGFPTASIAIVDLQRVRERTIQNGKLVAFYTPSEAI